LTDRVPDESTIRKLTRRLGPEVVDEITRLVIGRELRVRRFVARAISVDSPVVEADVRYPNGAALAADTTKGARACGSDARPGRTSTRGCAACRRPPAS
jgi:hypothetical protein